MTENTIICGTALEVLKALPAESISCCISSPPYWALRDYGVAGQLGLEKTFEEYIDKLCTIYDEVRRVLRKDGTCFVNLGDTYGGSWGNYGAREGKQREQNVEKFERPGATPQNFRPGSSGPGIPAKSLCLIPQRFAIEMCRQRGKYVKIHDNQIWLAALVDGEGCIAIHRRAKGRKNPTYGATLSVYNTCKELIDKAQAVCGGIGSRHTKINDSPRNAPVYEWRVMCNNAKDVLRDIYPYLIAKQYQARAAIFCPSSGKDAEECWLNIKAKNSFGDITRKYPEPRLGSADPWILRNTIIWKKPNPMPSSAKDRFTVDFEYVCFFVKSKKYWFEPQYEPLITAPHKPGWATSMPDRNDRQVDNEANLREWGSALGRNKRTTWTVPTQSYPEAHFATYPEKLVEPMIKAGCPEFICTKCGKAREKIYEATGRKISCGGSYGSMTADHVGLSPSSGIRSKTVNEKIDTGYTDCNCGAEFKPGIVWDPFVGSGTTLQVAARLGRNYGGSELKPEYIEMAEKRVMQGESGIPVKEQRKGQRGLFTVD